MAVYHQKFFKKVFEDFFSFLKSPKKFLQESLDNYDPQWIDKKWVAFVVFMHVYFLFNPIIVFSLNIMALFYTFISIGIFYYLSQICLEKYQARIGENSFDQKKLYVFAYVFSLAELVGLALNILVFVFSLSFILSIIGWVLAFLMTIPVLLIVIFLKLSVFRVVDPNRFSIFTFVELLLEAIIETFKNRFALDAWQELWADFNSQDV
jgi:hypothetical protein